MSKAAAVLPGSLCNVMDSTGTTELVNTFRAQLVAALKGMPDVAAALESLPDLGARTRYLRAVLARIAKQADPLLAAAVTLAVASTPAESLAPELAPRAGIVLSRHSNKGRKPERVEHNGLAVMVPAAVANLLREAMQFDEVDADRRVVAQLIALLPELAGLLIEQRHRKGSAHQRSIYSATPSARALVALT